MDDPFDPKQIGLPQNLCARPWTSVTVSAAGKLRLCCATSHNLGDLARGDRFKDVWSGDSLVETRKNFKNGEWPSSCFSCKRKEESLGVRSTRIQYHQNRRLQPSFRRIDFENIVDPKGLSHIEVSFSNVCNLKCRMCRSEFSSSWYQEDLELIKLGFHDRNTTEIKPTLPYRASSQVADNFYADLGPHWETIRSVQIKGGEPFLEKENIRLLEKLVTDGWSKHIQLQITTNGTILKRELLDLLAKFESISLTISADGLGSAYNYIRGGDHHSFANVDAAVAFFGALPNLVGQSICLTVQIYNIFQIEKFLLETDKFNWTREFLILTTPGYLAVTTMPFEVRALVVPSIQRAVENCRSEFTRNRLKDILRVLQSSGPQQYEKLRQFVAFTSHLDRLRGTNVLESLPELKPFYQWLDANSYIPRLAEEPLTPNTV